MILYLALQFECIRVSSFSLRHAGHAVPCVSWSSHDSQHLPLHVHGVGALNTAVFVLVAGNPEGDSGSVHSQHMLVSQAGSWGHLLLCSALTQTAAVMVQDFGKASLQPLLPWFTQLSVSLSEDTVQLLEWKGTLCRTVGEAGLHV